MGDQDRFRGNVRNPLVKLAAEHQVRTRNERARLHSEISHNIRKIGETKAQDELLTYLIGQCSEPSEVRRIAALAELERLFNGEPDGRLPAQQAFRVPAEPEPEDDDDDPECEVY